jgi:hypothetical protein
MINHRRVGRHRPSPPRRCTLAPKTTAALVAFVAIASLLNFLGGVDRLPRATSVADEKDNGPIDVSLRGYLERSLGGAGAGGGVYDPRGDGGAWSYRDGRGKCA